ncbi:hypothetical protein [Vineibacter terrae]|uniref:hypothetical protein n=1 Tax=Vineibacter terrae TaxID=2586908 RepID=UPI002E337E48|nr:hypothetical protein [Vineibacter terrae]HEX2889799.1 hypothetical protein [Vineibacter terrae]
MSVDTKGVLLRERSGRLVLVLIAGYVVAAGVLGGALVAMGAIPPWREGSTFELVPGTAAMLLGAVAILAYLCGAPPSEAPLRRRGLALGAVLFLIGLEEAFSLHVIIGSERVVDLALWLAMAAVLHSFVSRVEISDRAALFLGGAWVVHGLSVFVEGTTMVFVLSPAAAEWVDEFLEFCYVPLYGVAVFCLPVITRFDNMATTPQDAALQASFAGAVERAALAIWGEIGFRLFRLSHPGATFADFYAYDIERKLATGASHPTLGKRKRVRRTGQALDLTTARHGARGRFVLERLFLEGLRPEHRVVDYGCGSLRIGQHFISFLDPGGYWGLDVTDSFYRDGLDLLPPGAAQARCPHLAVIDTTTLSDVRAQQPDFIVCVAVLLHVPPGELDMFFDRLLGLRAPHSVVALWFDESATLVRTQAKAWAYPRATILAQAGRAAPDAACTVEVFDDITARYGGLPVTRSILWVRPRAAEVPSE